MHMDDGLDTGDIIDIVETDILPGETTGQLFERIAVLGGETIVPVLTRWVNGGNCGRCHKMIQWLHILLRLQKKWGK